MSGRIREAARRAAAVFCDGCRTVARETAHLFGAIGFALRPRELKRTLSRDTQSIVASSHMVASGATSTATNILGIILQSPFAFGRWLRALPFRTWIYLRSRTAVQLIVGLVVAAVGSAAIAWPAYTIMKERGRNGLRKEQYRQLELHLAQNNFEGVKHNITALQSIAPDDELIIKRAKALETGIGPDDDPEMIRMLMRQHMAASNLAASLREAKKYVALRPHDCWEPQLIEAIAARQLGNRAAARAIIARMPDPNQMADPPEAWSLILASRLFLELADQDRINGLVAFVVERWSRKGRSAFVGHLNPESRLQLMQLYDIALEQVERYPELVAEWAPYQEIAHWIANAPEASSRVLADLGMMQELHMEGFLPRMKAARMISDDQFAKLHREIEERLAVIWQRLLTGDPKGPFGYAGRAMQLARGGKLQEALALLDAGLQKCGPAPQLVEKKVEILRRLHPAEGLRYLEQIRASGLNTVHECQMLATAALSANRPDRALDAVKRAHELRPGLARIKRLEAEALMQAGQSKDAVGVLRDIMADYDRDPATVAMYVRALISAGTPGEAGRFLCDRIAANQTDQAILTGIDVLIRHQQAAVALSVLRDFTHRDPTNGTAQIALADALQAMAENEPGGWNRALVAEAVAAFRAALDRAPGNLAIINNIAWLELVALELPAQAYETAAPLRAAPPATLAPPILETIGATAVAVGHYEEGRKFLAASIRAGGPRATNLAYMAQAMFGLDRKSDALDSLNQALKATKSNPRDAELVERTRNRILRGVK